MAILIFDFYDAQEIRSGNQCCAKVQKSNFKRHSWLSHYQWDKLMHCFLWYFSLETPAVRICGPLSAIPMHAYTYMGILFPWILPHVHDKKLRIISRQLNTVFLSMKNSLKQLSRILIPKCVARQCIINLGTYSGILSRYTLFGIHIIISWWSIQKISFKCPT